MLKQANPQRDGETDVDIVLEIREILDDGTMPAAAEVMSSRGSPRAPRRHGSRRGLEFMVLELGSLCAPGGLALVRPAGQPVLSGWLLESVLDDAGEGGVCIKWRHTDKGA